MYLSSLWKTLGASLPTASLNTVVQLAVRRAHALTQWVERTAGVGNFETRQRVILDAHALRMHADRLTQLRSVSKGTLNPELERELKNISRELDILMSKKYKGTITM